MSESLFDRIVSELEDIFAPVGDAVADPGTYEALLNALGVAGRRRGSDRDGRADSAVVTGAASAPIWLECAAIRSMISRARYCSIPTFRPLVPMTATIALSPEVR